MKKTLAIVLALVMVLAMIPAMGAAVTENKTITDKSYDIRAWSVGASNSDVEYKEDVNTYTYEYNFENEEADVTSKWADDAKMALIEVKGFDTDFTVDAKIYVDGKELKLDELADYYDVSMGFGGTVKNVIFPVELTKAGYTDTYLIQVTETTDGKTVTETAKVTVVLKNTAEYKDIKTATITNIVSDTAKKLSAYIVGDKIYLDFTDKSARGKANEQIKITFADENKAAFTGITYAYDATDVFEVADGDDYVVVDFDGYEISYDGFEGDAVRLEKSAANFSIPNIEEATDIEFLLETKSDLYKTKKYDVVVRTGIAQEDPKGIYFAETTKTIAMGETYAPVVMGVKTGKAVAADIAVGSLTDKQVIDIVDNAVIGTREGVAYITATYEYIDTNNVTTKYTSSSMKIVVTLPGESIPALDPSYETYYVTCRALNVRAGAGTSYKKVDLIHRGDAVKVVSVANGWAKLDDGTYVCAKYIAK